MFFLIFFLPEIRSSPLTYIIHVQLVIQEQVLRPLWLPEYVLWLYKPIWIWLGEICSTLWWEQLVL